ncbi:hypothetical protein Tco_0011227 [Tanacetum coccineum]
MAKKTKEPQAEGSRSRHLWSQGEEFLLAKSFNLISEDPKVDKHKWKNLESTLARQNLLRVTDEDPEHFGEDALPRPPRAQRIGKSQHSSNLTASSGENPTMFQEMMQLQYELDRKTKMDVIE